MNYEIQEVFIPFSTLLGCEIKEVKINSEKTEVIFVANKGSFLMYHEQDCCESVFLEDVCGDWEDILNSPVLVAEEREQKNPDSDDESGTWTFYKIATIKGDVALRWYGASNGYYSESVDFASISIVD